ncbi:pilin [Marinomonas sp. IMCC 4694]|uniref:pilin n=1 Tax=Marinomonas sp. IMCC 4694 TaxID=2605432 RepID=UPI0011E6AEAA|nr:pilin [Marinomonas sp. IMCC 4694]TYL47916.1 pilin [Marinomonas sp. IMCC 4694]
MKDLKHDLRGFTLLELMVVIAIISILAGLSAPTFTRQIAKANLLEAQNIATEHQSLVEEYILLNGSFPNATEFTNIKSTLTTDSIAKSISIENPSNTTGTVVIALKNSTGVTEDQYLKYARDANRNWQCTSDLDSKILPLKCQAVVGEDK